LFEIDLTGQEPTNAAPKEQRQDELQKGLNILFHVIAIFLHTVFFDTKITKVCQCGKISC
jgi:hypothetical protein